MFNYFLLLASILCKKYIVISEIPANTSSFITENTYIIGDLRYDIVENEEISLSEHILSIEEDKPISLGAYNLQKDPIWNLDRIDQRSNKLNSMYFYHDLAGSGVWNYVLDTGIWVKHPEFEGRAQWGINVADNESQEGCMHPHGTHVAGSIGSKTYGVAKNTTLVSVKVLGCDGSGSMSNIIKALSWVASQDKKKKVINMSLGGGNSLAVNSAVEQISKLGVIVVVAAGNENSDACYGSPSSSPYAITVGAINKVTQIAPFSNWGTCVDVFAPGVSILSTMPDNRIGYMDGTSMACPHVSGIVSLILDSYEGKIDYEIIKKFMNLTSTKNTIIGDLKNSPNYLAFSLASL